MKQTFKFLAVDQQDGAGALGLNAGNRGLGEAADADQDSAHRRRRILQSPEQRIDIADVGLSTRPLRLDEIDVATARRQQVCLARPRRVRIDIGLEASLLEQTRNEALERRPARLRGVGSGELGVLVDERKEVRHLQSVIGATGRGARWTWPARSAMMQRGP